MSRHNLWFRPELWERVTAAAAKAGATLGKPLPTAVWVREAIAEKLGREGG